MSRDGVTGKVLVQNVGPWNRSAAAEIHQLGMVHGAVGFLAYLKQGGAVAGVRRRSASNPFAWRMELFFRVERDCAAGAG